MDIEINRRVAKYRKKSGMIQAEVAQMLDMKSSTYSQMERVGDISADRIRKLADIFKIDVRILLYGEDFEKTKPSPIPPFDTEKFVVLSPPPIGMKYIPARNVESSLISIYRNEFTKENQKQICELFDYLRKHKKTKLLFQDKAINII